MIKMKNTRLYTDHVSRIVIGMGITSVVTASGKFSDLSLKN